MKKKCTTCKRLLDSKSFNKDKNRLDGLDYSCRECKSKFNKAHESSYKERRTELWLKRQFGLTLSEYRKMEESQNGVCAICGKKDPDGSRLSVDHCHKTGKIRGLLCHSHNTMIGAAQDDVAILQKGIEYLRRGQEE